MGSARRLEHRLPAGLGARKAETSQHSGRVPGKSSWQVGARNSRSELRRRALAAGAVAFAVFVVGCGGSIGTNDGGTEDLAQLDQANALAAARLVVGRSLDAASLIDLAGLGLVAPVVDPARAAAVVPQDVLDCDNSPAGSILLTVNDRQQPSGFISTGDVASVVFSACMDHRIGRSVSGAADTTSIVVTDLDGPNDPVPPPPWFIGIDLNITGLRHTGPQGTTVLSGTVQTRQSTADGEVFDRRLSTTQLDFDDAIGHTTLGELRLIRLDDVRISGRDYTLAFSGRVSSTRLGGSFSFHTDSPLRGDIGASPAAGSLTVIGRNGTRLLVAAEPSRSGGVRITLDDEGDGIDADDQAASIATTWAVLGF